MAARAVRSRRSRRIRRLTYGIALLFGLALGSAAFLVGTGPGGRMALSLARTFLPGDLELEVGGFSGRLLDRFELTRVSLRIPALQIDVERLAVRWRAAGLPGKRVHLYSVAAEGVDARLLEAKVDSAEAGDVDVDSFRISPLPELPVDLSFDSVSVSGATLSIRDSLWASRSRVVIRGTLDDYHLESSGLATLPGLPAAHMRLTGTGSSTAVRIDRLEVLTAGGTVDAKGDLSWWPDVEWKLRLRADTLHPAYVLPDPEEWPGGISFTARGSGRLPESGVLALDVAVDTLHGIVRGERIDGRFEAHLRGPDLELPAARVSWGPAIVVASGTAGAELDLEFDATVPDAGLVLPGASGRVRARGRASGRRDAPDVRAYFEAAGLVLGGRSVGSAAGDVEVSFVGSEEIPRLRATFGTRDMALDAVRVESANAEVDVDLSGPVAGTVIARHVVVAGRLLDSAAVKLAGRRDAHRLEVSAAGPGGELELAVSGSLSPTNIWTGTAESLRLAADTAGEWTLTEPAALELSAEGIRLGAACLESAPARICSSVDFIGAAARFAATLDSLDVARFQPLMPDGLSARTVVSGEVDVEIDPDGGLGGRVNLRTTAGTLIRDLRGRSRRLFFEPIELRALSGPDGLSGAVDLHMTDENGARVLDITGGLELPVGIRSEDIGTLPGQPVSAHVEVVAADLLLITDDLLPLWDVSGSFRASARLEVDADGRLAGTLDAATDSMVLRNTVRGHGWVLAVDPARVTADVGPEGLSGRVALDVNVPGGTSLLSASGQITAPGLTHLDVKPAEQPVDGSLEVRVDDLSLVEAFLLEVADARGSFVLTTKLGGTLADLTVDGDARLSEGYALIPALGLELADIGFTASGRPDGAVTVDGRMRSGGGTLTLTGRSERYPSATAPTVFQVRGERFLVADIPEVNLIAEPSLDLAFDGSSARLSGEVVVTRGRLGFPEIPAAAITPSEDVIIVGDSVVERQPPVPLGTDITVTLGDDVFFNGFGFASNLLGEVRVIQEPGGRPTGRGEVRLVNGTYRALGQELRIEPGRLLFAGPIDDPAVDARAFVRASDGTEAGFRIGGTVQRLDVTTYSVPPKSDSDVMAYILFGRPMNQTSGTEGEQASNYAAVLGANMLAMSLAPSLGLDEARIDTGSSQNKAQLVVGKYLSPRLYIGYGVGIYEPISTFRLRYLLSARWSIEAITGDQQSTDLLWRIETGGPKLEATTAEGNVVATSVAEVQ